MSKVMFIFWDMDGTLFEFIPDGAIYEAGYFENLNSQKNIVKAAERVDGMRMVDGTLLRSVVLSNYLPDSPHDCVGEKNNALDRETHFSKGQRIFLPCGRSKWEAVSSLGLAPNAVLVDDYGKNTDEWAGPYIKVSRDAEDMKEEMQRHSFCISPDSDVDSIVNTICYAVENYVYA